MPKAFTMEMLEAMSLDQRKTLHHNALALETPAARQVVEMLASGDLLKSPAAVKAAAARPRAVRKKTATHGRQS